MGRYVSLLLCVALVGAVGACSGDSAARRSDEAPTTAPGPGQTPTVADSPDRYAWEPLSPSQGSFALVDQETGTKFNLRGEAIEGSLAEQKRLLRQLPGVNMFWFAWSVFHPGSEIWGKDAGVRQAELPADKTGVPGCPGLDCIPSLPNTGPPKQQIPWVGKDAAAADYLADDDIVVGVFLDGVARAYPHNIMWWHEIVNDRIGERAFSVTFCPLTGSALAFAAGDKGRTFGVSGQLFNSNLVMYDHQTESLWPQLWTGPVAGSEPATRYLAQLPLTETTWGRWKVLHPQTVVLSDAVTSRNTTVYPYGDYRTNHQDTFRRTDPLPDPQYQNKQLTFGLFDRTNEVAKGYLHADLAAQSERGVLNDTFNGRPIVIVWDASANLVVAFEASQAGEGGENMIFSAGEF